MKSMLSGIGLEVVATLLVAVAAWLTVAYTGAYNVAASVSRSPRPSLGGGLRRFWPGGGATASRAAEAPDGDDADPAATDAD